MCSNMLGSTLAAKVWTPAEIFVSGESLTNIST